MGWQGSARHWHNYEMTYLLLAGLATPLVLSVHTVVSFDFTISILPGWHSTIFPPYFVAGAIYSGFAMVLTLAIPLRRLYRLEDFITMRHVQNMSKLMLATGAIVAYSYITEAFIAWYSGSEFERYVLINRASGPYAWLYGLLILINLIVPQALWSARMAQHLSLFSVSRFRSTSGCGSNGSSSLSQVCIGIFCRRVGACITRPSGMFQRSSELSGCFLCSFSFSFACCR